MVDKKQNDETREPREAQSREKTSQRRPWAPPSALDAPEPPAGYVHRWVRTEVRGYPDFEYPSIGDGKYAGVIGVGGLLLCRIPRETVDERSQYFQAKTRDQMLSVDNDLMKEENPAMPINKNRQSRVTFGGNRGE
jgi:hypothetical protein